MLLYCWAELVIFRVLKFHKVRYIQYKQVGWYIKPPFDCIFTQ